MLHVPMNPPVDRPPSLRPREHGAYAQLGISLLAALLLTPGHLRAWAMAGATVTAFFAVEPLLVLLGRRGTNLYPARVARHLVGVAGVGIALAWYALRGQSGALFAQLLIPALPAGLLMLLFFFKRERTPLGELLGACTFAASAYPVVMLGGMPPVSAAMLAGNLTAAFVLSSLAVRTLRQPNAQPWHRLWRALPTLATLGLMSLLLDFHEAGWIPSPTWLALTPTGLATLVLAFWAPKRFKHLGWLLTAGALASALWTVVVLH